MRLLYVDGNVFALDPGVQWCVRVLVLSTSSTSSEGAKKYKKKKKMKKTDLFINK